MLFIIQGVALKSLKMMKYLPHFSSHPFQPGRPAENRFKPVSGGFFLRGAREEEAEHKCGKYFRIFKLYSGTPCICIQELFSILNFICSIKLTVCSMYLYLMHTDTWTGMGTHA